jgi:hypothetical protein
VSNSRPVDQPQRLPYCEYPTAKDTDQHGLQPLPQELPLVDLEAAQPYRSIEYKPVVAETLERFQMLQTARVVAESFALRESMLRHLNLPKHPAIDLSGTTHTDVFGTDSFGEWSWENNMYWTIRLKLLTDSTSLNTIIRNDVLRESLAILDNNGNVIGSAFNTTLSPESETPLPQRDDSYLEAMSFEYNPIGDLLHTQEVKALDFLCNEYPAFRHAYESNTVGHLDMIARSDVLQTIDTFELVVATMEHYKMLGYEYVVTSAANQWTGAAFEVLGGRRVHFAPYRTKKVVQESIERIPNKFSSSDGFISAKDSGCMIYVIRLK